jgi:paraquat-inducible protein A
MVRSVLSATPRMPEAVVIDDLDHWRECRECGLFQRLPAIPDGEAAVCARCSALLRRATPDSIQFARISTVVAALLFVLALSLPLVDLSVLGRFASSTVFSGPDVLRDQGFPALGLVLLATLVLMPAVKLALDFTVLFGMYVTPTPRWLPWLFGWRDHLSPWAMVEVFLLGSLVAYTRLKALAHVEVGPAAMALGGVMLCLVATDATLDREAIWRALHAKGPHPATRRTSPRPRGERSARLIGCDECAYVDDASEGERCRRCGHPLSVRRGPLHRIWALLLAAALLYVPANVLPVMTIKRLGKGGPTTIANGVVELAQAHLWPLALLVLLASLLVPMFKLLSVAAMLVMTHRRSPWRLQGRTRWFRLVKTIGRWSMIDIFALGVLVGVVRFGAIATVRPGMGALAFCAVVVITMAATEMFDPRRMWDAAGREQRAFEGERSRS